MNGTIPHLERDSSLIGVENAYTYLISESLRISMDEEFLGARVHKQLWDNVADKMRQSDIKVHIEQ